MLYPAPLRDLLIELAAAELFRAKWTNAIHDEWIRHLLENRPEIKPEHLERTRALMNSAVMDCLIEGYEDLIEAVDLPDKNDRHVLAAAIHGGCGAIITFNLKDFPAAALTNYNIEAVHPDDFVHHQLTSNAPIVVSAVKRIRGRLRKPKKTITEYLATLEAQRLPKTVAGLSDWCHLI